jgi:hypothetical protein
MFRWYGDVPVARGNYLLAATQSFVGVTDQPHRELNDYSLASLVAEFHDRLVQGMQGKRVGTRKIKPVALFPGLPLFEIRWSSMTVLERDSGGRLVAIPLALRLYHSEPAQLEGCFVGHLVHEKESDGEPKTRDSQNLQISVAARLYRRGCATLWSDLDAPGRRI